MLIRPCIHELDRLIETVVCIEHHLLSRLYLKSPISASSEHKQGSPLPGSSIRCNNAFS